jgi:SpoVK/Ycf46/Vps4 family AAA+-type ATPase
VTQANTLLHPYSNKKEMLDDALIRPGRADLTFEFHNADSDQIQRMFKAFYPIEEVEESDPFSVDTPVVSEKKGGTGLTVGETEELAQKYASLVPHHLLSTAAIQGQLT